MKKQVKIALLIVFLLFVISGIIICEYYVKKEEKDSNKNHLSVKFETSDIIQIENKLPISDTLGKGFDGTGTEDGIQGYVEFSITNTSSQSVHYQILLTKQVVEGKEIKDNYVKFYLTNSSDIPYSGFDKNSVPSYHDFSYLNDKPASKLLYSGSLNADSTEKIKLRIWLSDSYAISSISESFCVDVDVREK